MAIPKTPRIIIKPEITKNRYLKKMYRDFVITRDIKRSNPKNSDPEAALDSPKTLNGFENRC